jgi:hypothetical protein
MDQQPVNQTTQSTPIEASVPETVQKPKQEITKEDPEKTKKEKKKESWVDS